MHSTHKPCATGRMIKTPQPTHSSKGFSPESSHALLQPARSHQCMSYGQTSIVSPCFEPTHSGYEGKRLAIGGRLVLASADRRAAVGEPPTRVARSAMPVAHARDVSSDLCHRASRPAVFRPARTVPLLQQSRTPAYIHRRRLTLPLGTHRL